MKELEYFNVSGSPVPCVIEDGNRFVSFGDQKDKIFQINCKISERLYNVEMFTHQ